MSSENYYEAREFLGALIKNEDVDFIRTFMNHIYPKLSQYDQENISSNTKRSVMQGASKEVAGIFIEKFGMEEDDAHHYLMARMSSRDLERSMVDAAAKYCGEYYGAVMAKAIGKGDLEIAEALIRHHGILPVKVERSQNYRTMIANNRAIRNMDDVMENVSKSELLRIIEIVKLTGITGDAPTSREKNATNLFEAENLENLNKILQTDPWNKTPIIKNGRIENPEIIAAFAMKKDSSVVGELFRRIPVLIHEGDVDAFSSARVFHPSNRVSYYTADRKAYNRKDNKGWLDIHNVSNEWLSGNNDSGEPLSDCVISYEFTIHPEHGYDSLSDEDAQAHSEGVRSIKLDELLISEILPPQYGFGFNMPEGYFVAVVDIDELALMEMKHGNPGDADAAMKYVDEFMPVNLLSICYSSCGYHGPEKLVANVGVRDCSVYSAELFDKMALSKELSDAITKEVCGPLLDKFISSAWGSMAGFTYGYMQKVFGKTSSGPIKIKNMEFIMDLERGGYQFKQGSGVSYTKENWSFEFDVPCAMAMIRMGAWPCEKAERPLDLVEALKASVRRPENTALEAYIRLAGVEAVAKVAKSAPQWNRVMQIFPDDQDIIIKHAPKSLKRTILSNDLEV